MMKAGFSGLSVLVLGVFKGGPLVILTVSPAKEKIENDWWLVFSFFVQNDQQKTKLKWQVWQQFPIASLYVGSRLIHLRDGCMIWTERKHLIFGLLLKTHSKKTQESFNVISESIPKNSLKCKICKKKQWLVFYFPKVAGRSMPHKHCWWIFQFQCGKSKPPSFNQSFWWTKQHCQSNLNVFLLTTCQFLI